MHRLRPLGVGPWFMVGDFNEAMWQTGHFSLHKRLETLMANFRNVLSNCNLFDLGFHGTPWTYNNKQEGSRNVKVRLDRAVACPQWSSLFPDCKVSHIMSSRSDHCPLLIQLLGISRKCRIVKQLKYEAYWEREGGLFEDQIVSCWNEGTYIQDLKDVANNLNSVLGKLHAWSRKYIGYIPKKLEQARKRLDVLYKRNNHDDMLERKRILRDMDELLFKEEIL